MSEAEVGERFEDVLVLTPESIAQYAEASHDWNHLHHDPARAAASRFGTLIASGPHLAIVYMEGEMRSGEGELLVSGRSTLLVTSKA